MPVRTGYAKEFDFDEFMTKLKEAFSRYTVPVITLIAEQDMPAAGGATHRVEMGVAIGAEGNAL